MEDDDGDGGGVSIVNPSCPLATVLIPVYNSPDLTAALLSVLGQTYPRIQMIVLDDASENFSKTETASFLERQAGGNICERIVIQNSKNIGTVKNMNQGFRLAKGEYIFSLAGDDEFYDNEVIADWIKEFEETGRGLITAKRECYDEKMEQSHGVQPTEEQMDWIRTLPPGELFEKLCKCNFIFGCCTARSRAFLEETGLFDESYRLIDDYPMILQCLRKGITIGFYDRVVLRYRGGGASAGQNYNRIYKRDADRILKHEILPYTRHPGQARRDYRAWKREQEWGQYILKREESDPVVGAWLKLRYGARYPERIPGYIRNVFAEKTQRKKRDR